MERISAALDRRLDRRVAIKEMLRETGEAVERFEREVRITAKLQPPRSSTSSKPGAGHRESRSSRRSWSRGSLDKVIASTTAVEERLPLLPHVLAVADAIT